MDQVQSKAIILDDAEEGLTGFTQKSGVFLVEVTLAATGVHHSAIFTLYDNADTPTTVLTAGNGTYFSITKSTDTKTNCYWLTNQLRVENQLGQEETIFVSRLC